LEREGVSMESLIFCENAYEVARGADALVVVTEWNEFKSLDMYQVRGAMRNPVLIDGRNIYEVAEMARLGFIYRGIGRGTGPAPSVLPSGDSTSMQPLLSTLESIQ
jgi:UDPglucose 6-dehydrogenase